ncbi:MAG: hypothetical protein J5925_01015, partial [Clostridia bacterium]|nr:hypothetical protein [Clostridia bacterium]
SADGKKWELAGSVSGEEVVATPADGDWVEYSFPLAPYNTCNARYVRFDLSGAGMNYAWMHEICVWKYVEAEPLKTHEYTGTESLDNTTFKNTGHMGDDDGPAYCVYSNVGYNKAEMSFALSEAETSTLGRSGIRMNGFVFLGINAYNDEGYWCNCCDAGVCYTGENGGWSLFWGTADDGTGKPGWYSGGKTLDPARNYVLTLDSSQKDNFVVLTVTDADDGKVADRAEFRLAGTKADGSNTDYLTDIAVDWAGEESWIDADGNPTEDWREVLFACAGQKMCFKNIRIYGCTLYSGETRFDWDSSCTNRRGLCPDAGTDVYGTVITVHHIKADSEYVIDIDLG